MNICPIIKPEVPKALAGKKILTCKVSPSVYKKRNAYIYLVTLVFSDNTTATQTKGPFAKKSAAVQAKDVTASQIAAHTYVPYPYSVKDFYDFYLYYYLIDERNITYNTFMTYRNVIYNYIVPLIGYKKMSDVLQEDISGILNLFKSAKTRRLVKGLFGSSFKYASSHNILMGNPMPVYLQRFSYAEKKDKLNQIKNGHYNDALPQKLAIPDTEKLIQMLLVCRESYPSMYLPLLFAMTTGMRISETIAIKYSDIDYTNKKLYIERQLGRKLLNEGLGENAACIQDLDPKTKAGCRTIPLADFVLDEIILSRARYEKKRSENPEFQDNGYVCCQDNGKARSRTNVTKNFHKLLDKCEIPYFRWHDLRHIYATILNNKDVNLKAISSALGHRSQTVTKEVYIEEKKEPGIDYLKYLEPFIASVIPEKAEMNFSEALPVVQNEMISRLIPSETQV